MRRRDRDLERELEAYVEQETADNVERGMSPNDARYAALRKLGNPTRIREQVHEMGTWIWLENLYADVCHAARQMRQDRRYTAAVATTIAICMAANTAVFAVVNSVLLRPLPFPDSAELVLLANDYPRASVRDNDKSGPADYIDRQQYVPALAEQGLLEQTTHTIISSGVAEQVVGMAATPSMLRLLRRHPVAGRLFTDSEGEPDGNRKAILSHSFSKRLYGEGTSPMGRDVVLSGIPHTVVGVMPSGFVLLNPDAQVWTPLALTPAQKQTRHSNNYFHIGRMRSEATVALVQQQVDALNAANLDRFPQWKEVLLNTGFRTNVVSLTSYLIRDVSSTLYLLWAASAFLLLIGALNEHRGREEGP